MQFGTLTATALDRQKQRRPNMSIYYTIKGDDQVYRASSDVDMLTVYLRYGTCNVKIKAIGG